MSCCFVSSFVLNNKSVKNNINMQQALFFSLLKSQARKTTATKNYQHLLFNNRASNNETISIPDF